MRSLRPQLGREQISARVRSRLARLILTSKRAAATVGAVALAAVLISACSQQSGLDLARQACKDVHASIAEYDAAFRATNHVAAERDLNLATEDLQAAEPIAAQATSADGRWNALMTTLNELGQVDEGHLLVALRAQCAVADSNQPEVPDIPTTFPPVPSTDTRNGAAQPTGG